MGYITFEGSLVRKNDLREGKNGSKFMHISVARNYSKFNEETKEWEEIGTIFQDAVLFGKLAENFEASDMQPGSRLVISGRLNGDPARSYVNKEGVTVEVPASESIVVDHIGVSFGAWQQPRLPERGSRSQTSSTSQSSTKKPKQEELPEDFDVTENLEDDFSDFDGDLFSDDSSDDDGFDFFDDL